MNVAQSRGDGGKKGAEGGSGEGGGEDLGVLHNKAEMNSMITTLFDNGEGLVAPSGVRFLNSGDHTHTHTHRGKRGMI